MRWKVLVYQVFCSVYMQNSEENARIARPEQLWLFCSSRTKIWLDDSMKGKKRGCLQKISRQEDWHSPVYSGRLLRFVLPTPVHWCTLWGHWNFRLEFVMSQTSQHTRDLPNLSCDCDLWRHLVFRLLLALFRLAGLSKQKIIEPSLSAFIGLPFARVYMSSTGIL